MANQLATGQPFVADEMPIHFVLPDGSAMQRFVSFVYQPVPEDDEVVGVMAHGMDVTEQVLGRRRVEEREAYYRSLLEHSHDKITVMQPDGTITFETAAATRLLGWQISETVGHSVTEFIHPDDLPIALSEMQASLLEPGRVRRMELRLRHRDGHTVPFEILGHARQVDNGAEIIVNCRDISERREAEERARVSDERFRTLAESSPDGFMLLQSVRDDAGAIIDFEWLYSNPGATAIVGRTHEELIGNRLLAELPSHRDDGLFDAYVKVVETGTPFTGEIAYAHEGLDHALRVQAVRIGDGFGITFSDTSESHRSRLELRQREERFRALVELIPQLVWSTTPDGYHEYFNQRWYDYTGMKPGPGQGWNWKDYLHPDDLDRAVDRWTRSLLSGEPYEIEYRFRRCDGEYRWFIGRALPLFDESGSIIRWFGTCTDVHDEREALQAARSAQARFEAVAAATNDVIWEWEFETDALWWNEGLERAFGYTTSLMPDMQAWDACIHPDDRQSVVASLQHAVASGEDGWTKEYRFRRADGQYAVVLDRSRVVRDAAGNAVRMVGSMLDFTERARLEEEVRQSQKLEAIGKLAGGVAHDFNNLLTVISSYTEMLLADLPADAAARDDIDEVRKAANRASSLTRQLLAFSRRQVLQPRPLVLNEVVADMEKMLRRIIGENIRLQFIASDDVGRVLADPGQVEQVIMNLVVNARDAMPAGGTLTLATTRTTVERRPFALLTVSDTGVGMDEATLARIFEPFFTTKPAGEGTGLGLSTVHGIVSQSGGRIEVESEPGRGTTFRVLLPVTSAPAPQPAPPQPSRSPDGGAACVLVVEDAAAVRAIAVRTLRRHGYTVLAAQNGREALAVLDLPDHGVDLVLTDLVMPEMGGRELGRELSLRRNAPHVIFMSGYAGDEAALGPDDLLLQKPFTIPQLLEAVAEALERQGVKR